MPDSSLPMPSAQALSLPFNDAIKYFQDKVQLPTESYRDLWAGMHAKAFVVAGAQKGELLADLHSAVDQAISQGTTFAEFKKQFSEIVQKHGWNYRGSEGWRARVIYQTNLSTAYAAGRWKQMTDPDVLKVRPFLRYMPSSAAHPRPEHVPFYNVVLPADDPWWDDHYPPNDWGCKCGVMSLAPRDVERLERDGVRLQREAPNLPTYEWRDPKTGEVHTLPHGIGPGWNYNPGKAAWGRQVSDYNNAAWETLKTGNWASEDRPAVVPLDSPVATVGRTAKSADHAEQILEGILGGVEKTFTLKSGDFRLDTVIQAQMARHFEKDLRRTAFLPFLPETLEKPFEVWAGFEKHSQTGKYRLRMRYLKVVALKKDQALLMVADAAGGKIVGWTFVLIKTREINKWRQGRLLYGR